MNKELKKKYHIMTSGQLKEEGERFFSECYDAGFNFAEALKLIDLDQPELAYQMRVMKVSFTECWKRMRASKYH